MASYKQKLLVHYGALTNAETGIDVNHITDYLRRDNAVGADECEDIHSGRNCKIRAERLIDTLLEKDEVAYKHFYQALRDNHPHFSELLDETSLEDCDDIASNGACGRDTTAKSHGSGVTTFLPAISMSFTGRESEKQECIRWLQLENTLQRMYTITGPPGVGKTALITNACHQYLQNLEQPDHTCILFFDVRCIEAVEDLAVNMILALKSHPEKSPLDQVYGLIRTFDKDLVLLFDNAEDGMVERLKDEFLEFVKKILEANARVRVMMTSRESIKLLSAEVNEMKLNPLGKRDGQSLTNSLIPSLEPALVTRLCELTGHLPLGLHLLAIFLQGVDNPGEIISELETTPSSTLEALEAVEGIPSSSKLVRCFSTSFDRMDETRQSCVIACSVFPSSFDSSAAQRVFQSILQMTDLRMVQTQKFLRCLTDRSMLMFDENSRRYIMHPLIRSFSKAVAGDHRERWQYVDIQASFCEYFINFAEMKMKMFFEKDSCFDAVQQICSEGQNIVHAFKLCVSSKSCTQLLLRFASLESVMFLLTIMQFQFLQKIYEHLLESLKPEAMEERSGVFSALAVLSFEASDFESSLRYVEEAERLLEAANVHDVEKRTFCMNTKARIYAVLQKFDEADKIAKDSLALSLKHPEERKRLMCEAFSVEVLAEIHKKQFQKTGDLEIGRKANDEYNRLYISQQKLFGNHMLIVKLIQCHQELLMEMDNFEELIKLLPKHVELFNLSGVSSHINLLPSELQETVKSFCTMFQSVTDSESLRFVCFQFLESQPNPMRIFEQYLNNLSPNKASMHKNMMRICDVIASKR